MSNNILNKIGKMLEIGAYVILFIAFLKLIFMVLIGSVVSWLLLATIRPELYDTVMYILRGFAYNLFISAVGGGIFYIFKWRKNGKYN